MSSALEQQLSHASDDSCSAPKAFEIKWHVRHASRSGENPDAAHEESHVGLTAAAPESARLPTPPRAGIIAIVPTAATIGYNQFTIFFNQFDQFFDLDQSLVYTCDGDVTRLRRGFTPASLLRAAEDKRRFEFN
jgi:hypothetical protein